MATTASSPNADPSRDACLAHLGALGLERGVAQTVEREVFNEALKYAQANGTRLTWDSDAFRGVYGATARRVLVNLDPAVNPELRAALDGGGISARFLTTMRPEVLCPSKWADICERAEKRNSLLASGDLFSWSDQFQCSRCKLRKVRFFELQTRSADEPMTLFIMCGGCGHRWKN